MLAKKLRTLLVIAAGQADSSAPVMNELKRPLSRRGVAEVLTLLEDLKENPIRLPELILCSSSLYVRQTLDLLHEVLDGVDVMYKDALYAAPDYRILDMIKTLDDIFSSVMIIGELPGVKEFVNYVSKGRSISLLRPATGVILTLGEGETWHTFGAQKALCRPLVKF